MQLQPKIDNIERSNQLKKLRRIWQDCITDVPYYQSLVAQGKAPQEIKSWEDFYHIPILDRITLKEKQAQFHRFSGPPDCYTSTAGSTGQPLQIGEWRHNSALLRIAKLVPWIRLGYTLDNQLVLVWGHAHLLGSGWRRYYNHTLRKAKDWIAGYHRFDAYTLDPEKALQIAQEIIRIRPAGLIGYAALLDLLCRYTPDFHKALRQAGVKFVMPCAEPPPRSDTFNLLRSVFGCPIVQEFGGVDFGHVGFKIDDSPYTLFPELNILETEGSLESLNRGAALVTTLYKRYVPLIRYKQGDIITGIEHDEFGLVVAFDEQEGRVNDMITLSDGTSIHSVALVHCFKDEPSVFNVQLILNDDGPEFSLIVNKEIHPDLEQNIRHKLGQVHSFFSDAPFNYVTDLQTNRAGKRRWVIDRRTWN
ncbi:MAG: hypothetical protein ACFE0I_15970 [Elainellaceae cyanobacterium]